MPRSNADPLGQVVVWILIRCLRFCLAVNTHSFGWLAFSLWEINRAYKLLLIIFSLDSDVLSSLVHELDVDCGVDFPV